MLLSSFAIAAFALTAASAPPSLRACPASDGGVRLTDGTVYDGPIAENAILASESERRIRRGTINIWPVAYIYRAGRQVTLNCRYAERPAVIVTIARPVKTCRYTARGTFQSLVCR